LYVASITQHKVSMPASPSETTVYCLLTNGRLRWAAKFRWFCRGKPQNLANRLAKFSTENCGP